MAYQSKHTGPAIDAGITNIQQIFNLIYPVGSYYISSDSANPSTKFGGTWEQITDRMIMAAGSSYSAGTTGGASSHTHTSAAHTHTSAAHTHTTAGHTLTVAETPAHTHTRGTMNITGSWRIVGDGGNAGVDATGSGSGAISNVQGKGSGSNVAGTGWDCALGFNFNAANKWTGATSSVGGGGSHSHGDTGSTTPGNTGSTTPGNTGSSSNLPPYIVAYIWRRTA